jgi:hypothetical protein
MVESPHTLSSLSFSQTTSDVQFQNSLSFEKEDKNRF